MLLTSCLINLELIVIYSIKLTFIYLLLVPIKMLSKHFTLTQTAARKNQAHMDEECIITLERGYQIPGVSIAAQWFLLVNAANIFFSFWCTCLSFYIVK